VRGVDRAEKALNQKVQGFLLKLICMIYVRLDFGLGEFLFYGGGGF
jgi:hypothetical protein